MALDIQRTFKESRWRLIERTRVFERTIARNYKLKSEDVPDAKGVDLATLTRWNSLRIRGPPPQPPKRGLRKDPPLPPPPPPQTPAEGTPTNQWVQRRLALLAKHPNDTILHNWAKRRNEAVEGGLRRAKDWRGRRGG